MSTWECAIDPKRKSWVVRRMSPTKRGTVLRRQTPALVGWFPSCGTGDEQLERPCRLEGVVFIKALDHRWIGEPLG